MNTSKRLFGKPYFSSLVCKAQKHFMKKMLPFCLIVIGCSCHVMNDQPPLTLGISLSREEKKPIAGNKIVITIVITMNEAASTSYLDCLVIVSFLMKNIS